MIIIILIMCTYKPLYYDIQSFWSHCIFHTTSLCTPKACPFPWQYFFHWKKQHLASAQRRTGRWHKNKTRPCAVVRTQVINRPFDLFFVLFTCFLLFCIVCRCFFLFYFQLRLFVIWFLTNLTWFVELLDCECMTTAFTPVSILALFW